MNRKDAIEIFEAAVKAVQPSVLIPKNLRVEGDWIYINQKPIALNSINQVYLLSVGKAAAAMALEAEKILGNRIAAGLVITKYDHALPLNYCKLIEAGHPVPDDNSIYAARSIREFLQVLTGNDLLLCFISGGASALIGDIAEPIGLSHLQQLSRLLLKSGASIHEINTIRKHICTLKGGQMLRYTNGATVESFIISDVMGDDMDVIASGLTVADDSTFKDAWRLIKQYQLENKIPGSVKTHLQKGVRKQIPETPKSGYALFKNVTNTIIASNAVALQAAAYKAAELGYPVRIVDENLEGEAAEKAIDFVSTLINYTGRKPACLLMGGETTVTIKGEGKGGRNQEFVLAALQELMRRSVSAKDCPVILSAGTDGTDGPTDAAGAVVDETVLTQVVQQALQPQTYLADNDAYHFLQQVNALLITGATQTNVMDVVIGLIE